MRQVFFFHEFFLPLRHMFKAEVMSREVLCKPKMSERKVDEDHLDIWKELRARHANAEKFLEQRSQVVMFPSPEGDIYHFPVLHNTVTNVQNFSRNVMQEVYKLASTFINYWTKGLEQFQGCMQGSP